MAARNSSIIAQRRRKLDKREKDIQHAVYVLDILRPTDFKREIAALSPKWRRLAQQSLEFAVENFPLERPILARLTEES